MCGLQGTRPELHDPTDYSSSQAFALSRRWPFVLPGEEGLIYDSVRRLGGVSVCIWRPMSVPVPVRQGNHYEYNWASAGALSIHKLTGVTFCPLLQAGRGGPNEWRAEGLGFAPQRDCARIDRDDSGVLGARREALRH